VASREIESKHLTLNSFPAELPVCVVAGLVLDSPSSDSISDFPSEFKDSQDGAYDNGMQNSVGECAKSNHKTHKYFACLPAPN